MLMVPRSILVAGVATFALASLSAQNTELSLMNGATDDHVDVPPSSLLAPANGMTIEAWVTYDGATLPTTNFRWPTIARYDVTPNAESYIFRVQAANTNTRRLAFAVRSASTFQEVSWTFSPGQLTSRTHVAATWDGTMGAIIVNGMTMATAPIQGPMQVNPNATGLRIGNGDTTNSGHEVWNGTIDELRIWPFARSEAEIQATMFEELSLVPLTPTFNFNGDYNDSSLAGLSGAATGTVPFVTGAANLASGAAGAFRFGTPFTSCGDLMQTAVGSSATVGNTAFAVYCVGAPTGSNGALFLSANRLTVPISIFGIDLWLDPGIFLPVTPPVSVAPNGVASVPIALGASTSMGLSINAQFVFIDAGCGPDNLVASEGLTFVTQ